MFVFTYLCSSNMQLSILLRVRIFAFVHSCALVREERQGQIRISHPAVFNLSVTLYVRMLHECMQDTNAYLHRFFLPPYVLILSDCLTPYLTLLPVDHSCFSIFVRACVCVHTQR